jgi:hypothetical protein
MEQAAEMALTKGTTDEDAADGGPRSSVKLTRNKSSFFTCETDIAPQAQAGSPSLRSDYVSHLFLFLLLLPLYGVYNAAFFAFICNSLSNFSSLLCCFSLLCIYTSFIFLFTLFATYLFH